MHPRHAQADFKAANANRQLPLPLPKPLAAEQIVLIEARYTTALDHFWHTLRIHQEEADRVRSDRQTGRLHDKRFIRAYNAFKANERRLAGLASQLPLDHPLRNNATRALNMSPEDYLSRLDKAPSGR